MNILGYEERLIYTTHPWLVSFYLDCPPNLVLSGVKLQCPTPTQRESFLYAAKRGDITWHAGPMNMQYEALDASMVEFSLQLSEDMDARIYQPRQHRTMSQRDVPGMTQALLPILARHGIEGITVGVNTVSSPPAVPKIFQWVYQNTSLIAMWHPGGYPLHPGSFPSIPIGLSRDNCVTFSEFEEAMCFSFRGDNQGPPQSVQEVLTSYEVVRGQFPGAYVQASTFEDFVGAAQRIKDKLPVVDKEIGDTWIQGISSDPNKVAQMRAFFRARTDCLESGKCSNIELPVYNASRVLVKLAEHTWGLNSVKDSVNWTNDLFAKQLENKSPNFENVISSWSEQRGFLDLALETLGNHPLAEDVRQQYEDLVPVKPDLSYYEKLSGRNVSCVAGLNFGFDEDGSIIQLQQLSGNNWASPTNPLGQIIYKTYNDTDFNDFHDQYVYTRFYWLQIGKWNLTANCPTCESKIWKTKLMNLYQAKAGTCDILLELSMLEERASTFYGAPTTIYIRYYSLKNSILESDVQWFGKMPTRLAESISYSFQPKLQPGKEWRVGKLGQFIDPLNVVTNGSQRLHAIDKSVTYKDMDGHGIEMVSMDVALTTIHQTVDDVSVLPVPLAPITNISGISFNMFNNVWDCNYIFWNPYKSSEANQKFRFAVLFS
ncbi:hypothetical protein SNE40_004086 [Patella caerulea]